MSEGASEVGDVSGTSALQVGDSITALTYPLTEGLIIARSVADDSKLEFTIIVAPFKKRGQRWTRASVVTRDVARLSKKVTDHFTFPIKNVEFLRLEAKNAKADPAWAFTTCVALDRDFCSKLHDSGESEVDDHDQEAQREKESLRPATQAGSPVTEILNAKQDLLNERVEEVLKLKNEDPKRRGKKKVSHRNLLTDSDLSVEEKPKKHSRRRNKKKKASRRKRVSSSSNNSESSSSSSSDSSRTSEEVGEKGRTGCFTCPFHKEDSRGFKDIKIQIKGQAVSRKNIRIALHNLYAENHTLKSFADAHISQANASAYKPFSSDTAWLMAYARNIDAILLRSLSGPWSTWNEPVLDEIMLGFLDLVVRVSLNKEYPACLDDSVRKWMKKKRIGSNPKFGPVSYSLQHAKFTDCGPLVYQSGWNKQRDRNFNKSSTAQGASKGSTNAQGGGEKKPPSHS